MLFGQVVDLLLTMAKAALNSVRGEMIFDPFPNIVDPNDSQKLALSEKVNIHFMFMSVGKAH